MLLMPLVALTGCTPSAEEMLVGRWQLVYAIERVANVATGDVTLDTLPGYDHQRLTFMADATCMMTDRGDTTYYMWSLTGGNILALWREGWAEDYTVNQLTEERLVYNDTYSYYDSIAGGRFNYKYRFEYKKI